MGRLPQATRRDADRRRALPRGGPDRRAVIIVAAGLAIVVAVAFAVPGISVRWRAIAIGETCVVLAAAGRLPSWTLDLVAVGAAALCAFALDIPSLHHAELAATCALPLLFCGAAWGRRGSAAWQLTVILIFDAVAIAIALPRWGGPPRWLDLTLSAIGLVALIVVVDERNQKLMRTISREARVDALTGLPNRRGFVEQAEVELGRLRRDRHPCAVAMLDIDHFKQINDEWGHETGDRVLRRVGDVLREHAREGDVVGRFGGEEFVVLLPGGTVEGARGFADRVRAALRVDSALLPQIRLSAGVVTRSAEEDLSTLLAAADTAMYVAKRNGRDRTWVGVEDLVAGDR